MQHINRPHVMLIAGTESQGRAGLHSDLRALSRFPVQVSTVVTCITAQPSSAAPTLFPCPSDVLSKQIEAALELGPPQVIKVGLMGSRAAADALSTLIKQLRPTGTQLLIDPVMRSSAAETALAALSHSDWLTLLSDADLITPNWDEAAWLLDRPLVGIADDAQAAAKDLAQRLGTTVLLKGGHAGGDICTDWLTDGARAIAFQRRRIAARTRGTGCYLASGIGARLALGASVARACLEAGDTLNWALRQGLPPSVQDAHTDTRHSK